MSACECTITDGGPRMIALAVFGVAASITREYQL